MNILIALILSSFGGLSVYAAQKTGNLQMDDNNGYFDERYTNLHESKKGHKKNSPCVLLNKKP
jgi:hypothetical protein